MSVTIVIVTFAFWPHIFRSKKGINSIDSPLLSVLLETEC